MYHEVYQYRCHCGTLYKFLSNPLRGPRAENGCWRCGGGTRYIGGSTVLHVSNSKPNCTQSICSSCGHSDFYPIRIGKGYSFSIFCSLCGEEAKANIIHITEVPYAPYHIF